MKKIKNYFLLGLLTASVVSCQKDQALEQETAIAPEVIAQIKALGFGTDNIQRHEDGYLVEGDIIITPEYLAGNPDRKLIRIANVEQYRTTNLVSVSGASRTITIGASSSIPAALSAGIDNMIARFNAQNLSLVFQRVSTKANITIKTISSAQYIASAGFPTRQGNPYSTVTYNTQYISGASADFITTVLAHEVGHCIGFRHTDYMNRAYSCGAGGGGNEGDGGVGAIHIQGTPTDPDAGSWMLACMASLTTNRPFNSNDVIALNYLY